MRPASLLPLVDSETLSVLLFPIWPLKYFLDSQRIQIPSMAPPVVACVRLAL